MSDELKAILESTRTQGLTGRRVRELVSLTGSTGIFVGFTGLNALATGVTADNMGSGSATAGYMLQSVEPTGWEWVSPTGTGGTGALSQIYYSSVDAGQSRTSTSFLTRVSLTFPAKAEKWLIAYSSEVRSSDGATRVNIRLRENGTVIAQNDYNPDAGTLLGYGPFTGTVLRTGLADADVTYDIQYATSLDGKQVNIRRARIIAIRVTEAA